MNRWIITLLSFVFALGMKAQKLEYTKEDSTLVVKLLEEAKTERGEENRIMYFGKMFLGLPAAATTRDKRNQDNQDDQDVIILDLHRLTCTTFIEIVVALAMCDKYDQRAFDDFCQNLNKIRFREGETPSHSSRLHYITWWAEDNEKKGIVEDIAPKTEPWGPFTRVQTINISYMSSHPELYKGIKNYDDFMTTIKRYENATNGKQYRFIPKANLAWNQNSSLGMVKDGDIVAMVTNRYGLDVRHLGIVCWQNEALHLLHASSLYRRVLISKETYYEYEMRQPSHLGIRVFRFKD